MVSKYIRWFEDLGAKDVRVAGGKNRRFTGQGFCYIEVGNGLAA